MTARFSLAVASILALVLIVVGCQPAEVEPTTLSDSDAVTDVVFADLVDEYRDLTYEEFAAETPQRDYLEKLSFDVTKAEFYDLAKRRLKLTAEEEKLLAAQGMVSVDHGKRYSFGSMYYAIYTRDLPVLITTDSILHAMHRSYDIVLMDMEEKYLARALDEVLKTSHEEVARLSKANKVEELADNYRDVDLYLTVARNLLAGAGSADPGNKDIYSLPGTDGSKPWAAWDGKLLVTSKLDQDESAIQVLKLVQSLKLQNPNYGDASTEIYGGRRPIDYSQFNPRGHYAERAGLAKYFRAIMWISRADTAFTMLPQDAKSGIEVDDQRELRDAVLLTQVLDSTGCFERLQEMDSLISFMVGKSDDANPLALGKVLQQEKIETLADVATDEQVVNLQHVLRKTDLGHQRIRSQYVESNERSTEPVASPKTFQLFGQRYCIDSFALSKVVYDNILYQGKKQERMMPQGLDVMCALGNNVTVPLLKEDLTTHQYSANQKALREFVDQHEPDFWKENLYNVWLDALRKLDDDWKAETEFPEAMQTHAWQMKQLQTQLASWSELRHDTVLYTKQSYTAGISCEYPAGYVEPYPEVYGGIKSFAEEAARRIDLVNYEVGDEEQNRDLKRLKSRQVYFFKHMAEILSRLEGLANKELAGEPFSEEDTAWLKKTIDQRGGGSGPPTYDGWYCELFFNGGSQASKWKPTIVDVHTDPNSKSALEVGVGDCNFLVVAVDNGDDRMIYVGPAYSYYEFHESAEGRLTDDTWGRRIYDGKLPPRPEWTGEFQGAPQVRTLERR